MTLEQLTIFLAVAEREHLTQGAEAVGRTPSAVSAALKALEFSLGVALFDRVGRGLTLTEAGRVLKLEASAILARTDAARAAMNDLGGLKRGRIAIHASQTVAAYWLPPVMMQFHAAYSGIALDLSIGNTESVAHDVAEGHADIGFIEGRIDIAGIEAREIARDRLVIVVGQQHPWSDNKMLNTNDLLRGTHWVMREKGSGTRAEFERALLARGVDVSQLQIALELPSNEAVLSALPAGRSAAVISEIAAAPHIAAGHVRQVRYELPGRSFFILRHTARMPTRAASEFAALALERSA